MRKAAIEGWVTELGIFSKASGNQYKLGKDLNVTISNNRIACSFAELVEINVTRGLEGWLCSKGPAVPP